MRIQSEFHNIQNIRFGCTAAVSSTQIMSLLVGFGRRDPFHMLAMSLRVDKFLDLLDLQGPVFIGNDG